MKIKPLSKNERVILRRILDTARAMSNICFNGKQDEKLPENYRKSMAAAQVDFDAAHHELTRNLRAILTSRPTSAPGRK